MSSMQRAEHNVNDLHGDQVRTPRLAQATSRVPPGPAPRSATLSSPPTIESSFCLYLIVLSVTRTGHDLIRCDWAWGQQLHSGPTAFVFAHPYSSIRKALFRLAPLLGYNFTISSVRRLLPLGLTQGISSVALFLITIPRATSLTPVSELDKSTLCPVPFVASIPDSLKNLSSGAAATA
jgi:hypothetical protein